MSNVIKINITEYNNPYVVGEIIYNIYKHTKQQII